MSIQQYIEDKRRKFQMGIVIQTRPSETGSVLIQIKVGKNLTEKTKTLLSKTPIIYKEGYFSYKEMPISKQDIMHNTYYRNLVALAKQRGLRINILNLQQINGVHDANIELVADLGNIDLSGIKRVIEVVTDAMQNVIMSLDSFVKDNFKVWINNEIQIDLEYKLIQLNILQLGYNKLAPIPHYTQDYVKKLFPDTHPHYTTYEEIGVDEPFVVASEFLNTVYKYDRGYGAYRGSVLVKKDNGTLKALMVKTVILGERGAVFMNLEGDLEISTPMKGKLLRLKDM